MFLTPKSYSIINEPSLRPGIIQKHVVTKRDVHCTLVQNNQIIHASQCEINCL